MKRALVWAALVVLVAGVGIVANFRLLRLTQDARDPVGRLSPRAVFIGPSTVAPTPSAGVGVGTVTDADDSSSRGHDSDD